MRIINLLLILILFSSCEDTSVKTRITESDKEMLILANNVLSESQLNHFDLSNPIFEKSIDTAGTAIILNYDLDIIIDKKLIGGISSSTYIYPENEIDDMELNFNSYLLGSNFGDVISSSIKYKRTSEFEIPSDNKRVYEIYNSQNQLVGFSFNLLKKNKIIHSAIILKKDLKFEKEKLFKKISEL